MKYFKTWSLMILALIAVCISFQSCGDDDEPNNPDDSANESGGNSNSNNGNGNNSGNNQGIKIDKKLIGEWRISSSKSTSSYFFGADGKGYSISTKYGDDIGKLQWALTWKVESTGKITIHDVEESDSKVYEYEIVDNTLVLNPNSMYPKKYKYIGDNYDSKYDATQPPFNNYIQADGSYYYEITKMNSGCTHAQSGDNFNEQYLQFFGSSGNLYKTGLRVMYYTPRWEGIDSYWYSGTYTMSDTSGAYKYSAWAYCDGSRCDIYGGAKLRVSRSGSITTYDFTDDYVKLHVNVKSN